MSSDADVMDQYICRGWKHLINQLRPLYGGALVKDIRKLEFKRQIHFDCAAEPDAQIERRHPGPPARAMAAEREEERPLGQHS